MDLAYLSLRAPTLGDGVDAVRSDMASVSKRPDGRWRARYLDPDGRERAKHFARKQDAERWAAQVQVRLADGSYIDPSGGLMTVKAYAEAWRVVQDHRHSTRALYERLLRLHVYPALGDRRLSSLRHSDARAFVTGLSTKLAPNTARQVHAITRTIFRAAMHDRLIPTTPFANIKLPAVQRFRHTPLTVEEVSTLARAADPVMRALITWPPQQAFGRASC